MSDDKPESPHGSEFQHVGRADLKAQGYKPKGRAEGTSQHGAALVAWKHAQSIGKQATAVIGGRGWKVLGHGEKVAHAQPHMTVTPEGVLHAYNPRPIMDPKERQKGVTQMPLDTFVVSKVGHSLYEVKRYKAGALLESATVDLVKGARSDFESKRLSIARRYASEGCPKGSAYWFTETGAITKTKLEEREIGSPGKLEESWRT